jgi:WhiB family redox-sensing transcriptional regulator
VSSQTWTSPTARWGQTFSVPHPGEWIFEANCATADPEVFFPEKGLSSRAAIAVCQNCEVVEPCLDYALRYKTGGVWGGMSESQRNLLRRRRRADGR